MNNEDLMLIAVGGAASRIAFSVAGQFNVTSDSEMRVVLLDTDDKTFSDLPPRNGVSTQVFGSQRLSGRGTGGNLTEGHVAFTDDEKDIRKLFENARTAVVLLCTGGGTAGAIKDLLELLRSIGIQTLVIATTPFEFEGAVRKNLSSKILPIIDDSCDVFATVPLDKLVIGAENLPIEEAFSQISKNLADSITVIWRLISKPNFIAFDRERFNSLIQEQQGSKMVFVTLRATGENRVKIILEDLKVAPMIFEDQRNSLTDAKIVLAGVSAGNDLRLSELTELRDGVLELCSAQVSFELGTILDDSIYNNELCVSFLIFASSIKIKSTEELKGSTAVQRNKRTKGSSRNLNSAARFKSSEVTYFNGENIDTPTYERRKLVLRK